MQSELRLSRPIVSWGWFTLVFDATRNPYAAEIRSKILLELVLDKNRLFDRSMMTRQAKWACLRRLGNLTNTS